MIPSSLFPCSDRMQPENQPEMASSTYEPIPFDPSSIHNDQSYSTAMQDHTSQDFAELMGAVEFNEESDGHGTVAEAEEETYGHPSKYTALPSAANASCFPERNTSNFNAHSANNANELYPRHKIIDDEDNKYEDLYHMPISSSGYKAVNLASVEHINQDPEPDTPSPGHSASSISSSSSSPRNSARFRNYQNDQWQQRYAELVAYREKFGDCLVPHGFSENPGLARWCKRQRYQYKLLQRQQSSGSPTTRSTMTPERQTALEAIGFVWDSHSSNWDDRFQELLGFRQEHGHCRVPTHYPANPDLSVWVKCQRRQYALHQRGDVRSNLTLSRLRKLENVGFVFEPRSYRRGASDSQLLSSPPPSSFEEVHRHRSFDQSQLGQHSSIEGHHRRIQSFPPPPPPLHYPAYPSYEEYHHSYPGFFDYGPPPPPPPHQDH